MHMQISPLPAKKQFTNNAWANNATRSMTNTNIYENMQAISECLSQPNIYLFNFIYL